MNKRFLKALELLNKPQKEVVRTLDGSILVLAGAGSGKTMTLVSRVVYMLEKGVDPKSLLLLTFTNKAANEMQIRVQNLLSKGKGQGLIIGTFHGFCNRLLRKYYREVGFTEYFSIHNDKKFDGFLKEIMEDLGIDIFYLGAIKSFFNEHINYQSTFSSLCKKHKFSGISVQDFEVMFDRFKKEKSSLPHR